MATNEFRWGVKPTIPGQWRNTLLHDGFEIEIASDWVEARKDDDGRPDAQQRRAEQIVEGIVRRIGLVEKKRFMATLGSVSRFDPQTNRRDIGVHASGVMGVLASGHADVVVTSSEGAVISDSRQERMAELFQFANASASNETLRRMTDYLLDYRADPAKKLASLFDIIERAEEVFGHAHRAARVLNIDLNEMKEAVKVMHNPRIRSSRHPGQEAGPQRDPTPDESRLCESVAEKIVTEYAKLVQKGTAPG